MDELHNTNHKALFYHQPLIPVPDITSIQVNFNEAQNWIRKLRKKNSQKIKKSTSINSKTIIHSPYRGSTRVSLIKIYLIKVETHTFFIALSCSFNTLRRCSASIFSSIFFIRDAWVRHIKQSSEYNQTVYSFCWQFKE